MPARKHLMHSELVRQRIKTAQIVNRLQAFVLGTKTDGRECCVMTAQQVNAALGLLKKALPDLHNIDLSGSITAQVTISTVDEQL